MTDPAPPAPTTLTESEAYRIAAGALRHIPSGYAVEGQQCGDSVVAALLHFTTKAFAEGRLAGLLEAVSALEAWRIHEGIRSVGPLDPTPVVRGLAEDALKAPKTPSDPDPR